MTGPLDLLFPPKCVLCRGVLPLGEKNICLSCRENQEMCPKSKTKLHFLDSYSAVWYYEGNVRRSILRLKFSRARHLAPPLGRILAEHIREEYPDADIITWVPISTLRRLKRGYDQMELVARSAGYALEKAPVRLLKKSKHNKPQSGLHSYRERRANVEGVYEIVNPARVAGKRVLLLDDVITTGATAGECAKVLRQWGAREVHCAAIAVRKE